MSRRIVVVSAGVGTPSTTRLLADQLADATLAQVTARGEGVEFTHIELRELATDLATMMTTGMSPTALDNAFNLVRSADGIIAVSPVFAASYSGLFKMFFDAIDKDALVGKPVLMGANAGTARHSLAVEYAMRPLFAYLRADIVPTGVFAATDDFGSGDELNGRVRRAAEEFATHVVREEGNVVGFKSNSFEADAPLRSPKGFADLLKGHSGRR